jgi:hypothetical protein
MKTIRDLPQIRSHYETVWKKIKAKYPAAHGSLKFANGGDLTSIHANVFESLKENPRLFKDNPAKMKAMAALKSDKGVKEDTILSMLGNAELNPTSQIVIVWSELDYEIIKQLQYDPIIDQDLTPKTAASIKIVLGVIGE